MITFVKIYSIFPNQEYRDKQCRMNPSPSDKGPVGIISEAGD